MKTLKFFDNMNECVYAMDMDTYELVYMNKRALEVYGVHSLEDIRHRKCFEVLQHCSAPCAICNNDILEEGSFQEWEHYNPLVDRYFLIKDTMLREDGRRYRVEIAIESASHANKCIEGEAGRYENMESLCIEAFKVALRAPTPDRSIDVVLEYLGKALNGERTYIFERRENGFDDNTYEWVAAGIRPEKDNLQKLPPEVCANWYRNFSENRHIVIDDLEDIREEDPLQYANLKRQDIHSLAVVPLYDNKKIIGFYGVDNPPQKSLEYASNMLYIMGYFIISCLKRRDLVKELKAMSYHDQLTGFGNRYALNDFIRYADRNESLSIVYCDVTGLKRVNDTEGHEMGDRLLINACACLRRVFHGYGLYRIGGDEFLAVGSGQSREELGLRTDMLRKDMEEHSVVMAVGTVWRERADESLDTLLTEAERRMYQDKSEYYKRTGIDRRKY